MPDINLYFQVHQPNRLKRYTFFDLGQDHFYENDELNGEVCSKVSDNCYLPANEMMLDLIKKHGKKFKVSFSLSGVAIEQFEEHRPDVLESFKKLAETGCVEFLSETFYHSLAFFYSKDEFTRQIKLHKKKIKEHFGVIPKVFRNTELSYNNAMAAHLEGLGYKGVITEGVDWYLNGRTPNQLYTSPITENIKVLFRNHILSDDIAFRFSDKSWADYPLTPEKLVSWINTSDGEVVNICMDYEAIGEHQWKETGIFDFFKKLPEVAINNNVKFITPSKAVKDYKIEGKVDIHNAISWADYERDLSAWRGNSMQHEALKKLYELEELVKKSRNKDLIHVWSKLQTSDHFYYLSTKGYTDGMVHNYFSPYDSPYNAYIYYMNVLSDIEIMLNDKKRKKFHEMEEEAGRKKKKAKLTK